MVACTSNRLATASHAMWCLTHALPVHHHCPTRTLPMHAQPFSLTHMHTLTHTRTYTHVFSCTHTHTLSIHTSRAPCGFTTMWFCTHVVSHPFGTNFVFLAACRQTMLFYFTPIRHFLALAVWFSASSLYESVFHARTAMQAASSAVLLIMLSGCVAPTYSP